MNDTELDEILNSWSAPPAPASLRERVRAGFAAGLGRETFPGVRHWTAAFVPSVSKSLVAGAILALGTLLLVVAQAFPQMFSLGSPPVKIPYTVDSEFVRYAEDGSSSIEMYSTSYSLNGHEILLSRSLPGNLLGTAIGRTLDATLPYVSRLMSRLTVDAELLEKVRRAAGQAVTVTTGCGGKCLVLEHYGFARATPGAGCLAGPIVGRETILNYPTVAVQRDDGGPQSPRMTLWTSPDLGCFALRITIEERQPDGTFRLVSRKQALKVTMNP
jgi:hypothetical protein